MEQVLGNLISADARMASGIKMLLTGVAFPLAGLGLVGGLSGGAVGCRLVGAWICLLFWMLQPSTLRGNYLAVNLGAYAIE